jgi:Peptidase family M28
MKHIILILILIPGLLFPSSIAERADKVTKAEMQSVLEFLSHDLLEGRSPATRGGNLAEIYMKSLFKFMGLQPGDHDRYFQAFTLKGFTVNELNLSAGPVSLKHIDDVVGTWIGSDEQFNMEADLVFVGFGINASLWKWDDYKNIDVKNKIVVTRVNDPGMYNDKIFEGKTLTYYGRWTYHIEEAARRGAAGILMIHTDAHAGYDWNVVKNSWSGEEMFLESELGGSLKFRGWIKESRFKEILDTKKIKLEKLYKKSLSRKFKPVDLGMTMKISGKSSRRDALNHNVIGVIPGKSKQQIVLSAHIDHLGMLEMKVPGQDVIINGAIDNASAVSSMMVVSKILKEFQKDLQYTIVVLACQSEEANLLGSKYYVQSLTPEQRKNVIANINFESTPVWEKTSDFMAIGARFSTLEDMLKKLLKKEGLDYSYFSLMNQGLFYRSDQFSFARYGIPAIWISAGENDGSGLRRYPLFWKSVYHTVKEEYNPNWPLESMKQTIKMALLLIDYMDKTKERPKFKDNLTFPLEK